MDAPAPGQVETPQVEYQPLDPRAIRLWRIRSAIGSAILLPITLAAVLILGFNQFTDWEWLWMGWAAFVVLRAYLLFWHQKRVYRAWGYRLDGKVLETRHGIWFRQVQLLPLARLQHVDLHSGPIERSLGLASL